MVDENILETRADIPVEMTAVNLIIEPESKETTANISESMILEEDSSSECDSESDSESETDSVDMQVTEDTFDAAVFNEEEEFGLPTVWTKSNPPKTRNERIEAENESDELVESLPEFWDGKGTLVSVGAIQGYSDGSRRSLIVGSLTFDQESLDIGNVLVCADGRIIGAISDVFGPVRKPFYVVKMSKLFMSRKCSENGIAESNKVDVDQKIIDIITDSMGKDNEGSSANDENEKKKDLASTSTNEMMVSQETKKEDDDIIKEIKNVECFCVVENTSFVDKSILSLKKGCDASNAFDEEVPEEDMEYSDDEAEQQQKARQRKQKRKAPTPETTSITDISDYVPLTRPSIQYQ